MVRRRSKSKAKKRVSRKKKSSKSNKASNKTRYVGVYKLSSGKEFKGSKMINGTNIHVWSTKSAIQCARRLNFRAKQAGFPEINPGIGEEAPCSKDRNSKKEFGIQKGHFYYNTNGAKRLFNKKELKKRLKRCKDRRKHVVSTEKSASQPKKQTKKTKKKKVTRQSRRRTTKRVVKKRTQKKNTRKVSKSRKKAPKKSAPVESLEESDDMKTNEPAELEPETQVDPIATESKSDTFENVTTEETKTEENSDARLESPVRGCRAIEFDLMFRRRSQKPKKENILKNFRKRIRKRRSITPSITNEFEEKEEAPLPKRSRQREIRLSLPGIYGDQDWD